MTHVENLKTFLASRNDPSERTLEFYRDNLSPFLAHLDREGIKEPRLMDLDRYMAEEGQQRNDGRGDKISKRTRHARMRAIRAYVLWGAGELWPALSKPWRLPRLPKARPKYLTDDQVEAILEAAGAGRRTFRRSTRRNAALVSLAIDSGLRRHELAKLTWRDVDMERRTVFVTGKGEKDRETVFGERTAQLLAALAKAESTAPDAPVFISEETGKELTGSGMRLIFQAISRRSGIPFTAHILRHTACFRLVREIPVPAAKELMGHSSLATTEIYATWTRADAVAEARKAFARRLH